MVPEPVPAQTYLDPEPRTWPKVLGILGALWGGIGLVSSALALAGVGQQSQPAIMRGGLGAATNAVAALLALAMLVGGVQLVRQRAMGVRLMQAWAPLSALAQAAVLAIMITHRAEFEQSFRDEMERQAEARGGQGAPQGMEKVMFTVGLGCGGVLAVIPPAIVAVFVFGRRGREALAEWSTQAGV
ncbi:MAG: hypothetical protein ACKPEA_02185 [Planctomycetota bacterium]